MPFLRIGMCIYACFLYFLQENKTIIGYWLHINSLKRTLSQKISEKYP